MQLPALELKKTLFTHLDNIVGPRGYSLRDADRLSYSRDSNFRAAIQAHYSHFENFPAIITWPENTKQVEMLVKTAIKHNLAITPFGGGSGVCGGAVPRTGGMVIDLKRMNHILRIDEDRLTVEAEAGIHGLQLEKDLNRHGHTLGHFPSSILSATLGGYLAARSAGQLSTKYGKIEDMIIDLEFVDGQGLVHQTSDISRNQHVDFTQAIVGNEGTLGLITKARLKIFPMAEKRLLRAVSFKSLSYGIDAMRRIMHTGLKPDVMRLYDELDTTLMFSGAKPKKMSLPDLPGLSEARNTIESALNYGGRYLKPWLYKFPRLVNTLGGLSWHGNVMILMIEGTSRQAERTLQIILGICQDMSARDLGEDLAQHWYEHRYSVAYKATTLFKEGAFTDTMEVSTTWDNLTNLYRGVTTALKGQCLVLAHISHVYTDGAAIYFTFVAPLSGLKSSLKLYDKIWQKALSVTQKQGGSISHHHGIGRLKKNHIRKEWEDASAIYLKLKSFFDPNAILNPDVLTQ
jgi:alkyldihydroxyacetonephosphate synthase